MVPSRQYFTTPLSRPTEGIAGNGGGSGGTRQSDTFAKSYLPFIVTAPKVETAH
jgi:hypothetical protein